LTLQESSQDIVNVLIKSMMDLPDLICFFARAMQQVNPIASSKGSGDSERSSGTFNLLALMVETLTILAN
jgi:hypothetical protein